MSGRRGGVRPEQAAPHAGKTWLRLTVSRTGVGTPNPTPCRRPAPRFSCDKDGMLRTLPRRERPSSTVSATDAWQSLVPSRRVGSRVRSAQASACAAPAVGGLSCPRPAARALGTNTPHRHWCESSPGESKAPTPARLFCCRRLSLLALSSVFTTASLGINISASAAAAQDRTGCRRLHAVVSRRSEATFSFSRWHG